MHAQYSEQRDYKYQSLVAHIILLDTNSNNGPSMWGEREWKSISTISFPAGAAKARPRMMTNCIIDQQLRLLFFPRRHCFIAKQYSIQKRIRRHVASTSVSREGRGHSTPPSRPASQSTFAEEALCNSQRYPTTSAEDPWFYRATHQGDTRVAAHRHRIDP